jgi:hypothetical protein
MVQTFFASIMYFIFKLYVSGLKQNSLFVFQMLPGAVAPQAGSLPTSGLVANIYCFLLGTLSHEALPFLF